MNGRNEIVDAIQALASASLADGISHDDVQQSNWEMMP
jgi:hypothetical protein